MATANKNIRVLMLCDFFYPFDRGGSEQSVLHLQKSLLALGVESAVFTPEYQKASLKKYQNIQIFRFPFFPKLTLKHQSVSPIFYLNPVFWIMSCIVLAGAINKYKPTHLHVQGKYLLPASIVVGKWNKIPVIVTLRDYLLLCPLSFCINKENQFKACNLKEVLSQDLSYYFRTYKPSINNKFIALFGALYGWVSMRGYKWLLAYADKIIAISERVKKIYETNNVRIDHVIHNSFLDSTKSTKQEKQNSIIYVGRLTKGKGVDMLIDAYQRLQMKQKPMLHIVGDGVLESSILELNNENIRLHGQLGYEKTLKKISEAKILVVPSLWEEPFGRVALEALMLGTPVITSNNGGLAEIVHHKVNGQVVSPTPDKLATALKHVLSHYKHYRQNALLSFSNLKQRFYLQPRSEYIKLYKELL